MNKIKYRDKDDPKFLEIKEANFMDFLEYMKDKDIYNIRLPVNNTEAYQYLRWLNAHYHHDDYGSFLNYVLNCLDAWLSNKPVRPPTPREVAVFNAKRIVDLADREKVGNSESDRALFIDIKAESIRDAYLFCSYPIWIVSGLAGCVMKWGTFEDNEKPGDSDKYITYEEYDA